jgi:uncharacterized protein
MSGAYEEAGSRPLDDAELDRLQALLASPAFEQSMPADVLQGFLAAVVSGPELVPPSVWMPIVRVTQSATQHDVIELDALVMRFYNEIAGGLYSGEGFTMVVPNQAVRDEPDYEGWCMGYLEGSRLWGDDLDALLEEPALGDPYFRIEVLAGDYDEEIEQIARDHETTVDDFVDGCRESLLDEVHDIYEYWLERRKGTTIRREAPKIGRNDPCPCGSGKKFKLCHGASGGLH